MCAFAERMGVGSVIWNITLSYGRESSIAGFNNAFKAKSRIRSFLWITIFAVLGIMTIVQFVNVIVDYYQYPVITMIDLSHKPSVPFPAVTVCNLNRLLILTLESLVTQTLH